MKRAFVALAALVLIAAAPQEVIPDLDANGYYIEPGSGASEEVVSDAVFEGRADGGRLYIVVLAEEPPGGAPTFADSVLDELQEGYVLTVSPETVGYAGDGSFWTSDQMDAAVDASLAGGSDDEVVQLFISNLTGMSPGGEPVSQPGGGISIWWIVLLAGGGLAVWWFINNRNEGRNAAGRLARAKEVANGKLAEVANDILEMEDEVNTSDNAEVKTHYQTASAMYAKAIEDNEKADSLQEMLEVSRELDLAIWELDCAEALLDGKARPPKPEPPQPEPVAPPPPQPVPQPPGDGTVSPSSTYDRRPQRQSGGNNDLLTMLLAMTAMRNMGGRGGFGGGFGGWTGGGRSGGGGFRGPMGGGGGRMRGGGRRG